MAADDERTGVEQGDALMLALTSSSTTTRTQTLNALSDRIKRQDLPLEELPNILRPLFQTHVAYHDRDSRKAVRNCLGQLLASETYTTPYVQRFLPAIKRESQKAGIAASSAFNLLEWTGELFAGLAKSIDPTSTEFTDIVATQAGLLSICMGTPHARDSLKKQAIRVTRRSLRTVFRAEKYEAFIRTMVKQLTTKGAAPTAKNAVLLGVVSGVAARIPKAKETLEGCKQEIYAFYVREIIGSRTVVPDYIVRSLGDFVSSFITAEDFLKEIVPAVEKGLLRSPEIVLNDILAPLLESLDPSIDLSQPLNDKLLKPLLASLKSSNAVIRNGAVAAFKSAILKSYDNAANEKITDEILKPLKTNKLSSADQRTLHATMLDSLPPNAALSKIIPAGLAGVAVKEPNEAALTMIVSAIITHLAPGLKEDVKVDKTVVDAVTKGMSDKRAPVRRLWILKVGDLIWSLPGEPTTALREFGQAILGKLMDVFNEAMANPIPAAQNGLTAAATVTVAVALGRLSTWKDEKLGAEIKKAKLASQCLTVAPKTSFLLNHKAYSKLATDEDFRWATRALSTIADQVIYDDSHADLWAAAFLYLICAAQVSPACRREARDALTAVYLHHPENIGKIILSGLWTWVRGVEIADKDSVVTAAKTGATYLKDAIHAITPGKEAQVEQVTESLVDGDVMKNQLVNLSVISHHELITGIEWIPLCQKVLIDPGQLASEMASKLVDQIRMYTGLSGNSIYIRNAALKSAATLAFVAPEAITSLIVNLFQKDLDAVQLKGIGEQEIGMWRSPPDVPFVDVLAKGVKKPVITKSKDAGTLKWEAEVRAELEKKKGVQKKLTPQEKALVDEQLAKEAAVRQKVNDVELRLIRGVGIIQNLAVGAPTAVELWLYQAVTSLLRVLEAGAGLIIGDAGVKAYLACAEQVNSRLGIMRPFIGVATLRAMNVTELPQELTEEPLGALAMRVLYRLRFAGEQRPFDVSSLFYIVPFINLIMAKGGIGATSVDDVDEQVVLALDFLSFHTETFSNPLLPRGEILEVLIFAMQKYNAHYKAIKDVFLDLCRCLAPTVTREETAVLINGTISTEVNVRTATLQALDAEIDLSEMDFSDKIWLACHDEVEENVELAQSIWETSGFEVKEESVLTMIPYLSSAHKPLRASAARGLAAAVQVNPQASASVINKLVDIYREKAKPLVPERDEFGLPKKMDLKDPWEARSGIAMALKEMAPVFEHSKLPEFCRFLIEEGALADRNHSVRDQIIEAATAIIAAQGATHVEELMKTFEATLEAPDTGSGVQDQINEAVIILYGALGRHLGSGDARINKVIERLLATLSVPSETVQYAVALCLPPLIRAVRDKASGYIGNILDQTLTAKQYAARRGAAYGLAGIIKGCGIGALKEYRVMSRLKAAVEDKKDPNARQGALFAYELLSSILGRIFEPYVIQILPSLLSCFGDSNPDVREATSDAAKACFSSLSSYGVKVILPDLLEGLEDDAWRSKKGACETLGAFAYLAPHQLAVSLPEIIPPLSEVLNDSHKEVRNAANRSLKKFGEVISNPEIREITGIILKALSDPTKYTDDALDALMKVNFVHYLDSPSLALVVRVLERGMADRSATKRKASQIIGSLVHLTERKDIMVHINVLVGGLKEAIVDPVPATRATASKSLGSLVGKLGEDSLPDIIPGLMATLKSDTGAGDRLGSAQALSEVLSELGTQRLEETFPTILQNVASPKPAVREGFMSLFIFLPACFGNSFSQYLSKIIPPILSGLADEVESIRDTSLRAGRLLVKNFATRAIDLLLPELERGLADINYRIRLSSVELVGDLLFNLTGISGKEQEDVEFGSQEVSNSLLEVLGQEKRDKILSALYICRCDTSGAVRLSAANVWKALVSTPRTLKELVPTLVSMIIRRLGAPDLELRVIAGQALGELIRKAGENVLATLLPSLEEGLRIATDADQKQGICVALKELIQSTAEEALEEYEEALVSIVRTALVDSDADVRESAAEAFDALQRVIGKRAVDQVLPHLLTLLQTSEEADNALAALLTLLTEHTRSQVILPSLIPRLIAPPITRFNARALASLAEVAGSAVNRRLPQIMNALIDAVIGAKDPELHETLGSSLVAVLVSVDEYDGLNTMMSEMFKLVKHDDHHKRAVAAEHFGKFFAETEVDYSRYTEDCIRILLIAFDDPDKAVVKAAWSALTELTKKLRKEEMENLVVPTRKVLRQVGVAGHNLPGFDLPKGINAILPIFLQGLMYGTPEQRTQAALAISDIIERTSPEALRPSVTQITGPLIRVVSERSVDVKAAILLTLNNLLQKIPAHLKPFLPQLQRTFAKALADTGSELLRTRAAKALGTLITLTPRIDPLIAELVAGAKTDDEGVKDAMLKALYEVVSKAGKNMGEPAKASIFALIENDLDEDDENNATAGARLMGVLVRYLSTDDSAKAIRNHALKSSFTKASILTLNSVIVESPETLVEYGEETAQVIAKGINHKNPYISDNSVLAAGKFLLSEPLSKSFESNKILLEALKTAITGAPSGSVDTKRLALVVIRTVSRKSEEIVRPHLALLAPAVFGCVRDMVIPVKLASEQAFIALFQVTERGEAVFEKYIAAVEGPQKRSMNDYFKRVGLRLAAAEKDRAEAGGAGLGLNSDEVEDLKEVMSVGKGDFVDSSA